MRVDTLKLFMSTSLYITMHGGYFNDISKTELKLPLILLVNVALGILYYDVEGHKNYL